LNIIIIIFVDFRSFTSVQGPGKTLGRMDEEGELPLCSRDNIPTNPSSSICPL